MNFKPPGDFNYFFIFFHFRNSSSNHKPRNRLRKILFGSDKATTALQSDETKKEKKTSNRVINSFFFQCRVGLLKKLCLVRNVHVPRHTPTSPSLQRYLYDGDRPQSFSSVLEVFLRIRKEREKESLGVSLIVF